MDSSLHGLSSSLLALAHTICDNDKMVREHSLDAAFCVSAGKSHYIILRRYVVNTKPAMSLAISKMPTPTSKYR